MSHKKDRRLVQSERTIIEAGIGALLANPSAGMSEIAELAGVGRATLYRHFKSREDLVRRLALVCLQEIDDVVKPHENLTGRALIEAIIEEVVPLADRFRFLVSLWSFVENDKEIERISARMDKEMFFVFDQAKKQGDIGPDLPTTWLVSFFDSTLDAAWTSVESGQISSAEAVGYVKKSFFHGCGSVRREQSV